ncbi:MMPL family transporter [Blastococcus sp. Marseille-P5729]|uniref:MMPL family transporter n=1 Tax=Blastococcus sp. Marseille-P5729 TaxID=2086582 RepID=UPI000D10D65E|nr:MMPL family transporter [Blastococcus sp. Marseille-P5729]
MFNWLAAITIRFRKALLALTVVGAVASAVWGLGVFDRLGAGGFDDPADEAILAVEHLDESLGRDAADLVLIIESPTQTVDDPAYRADVQAALDQIPPDAYGSARSYWSTGAETFVGDDRHDTYVVVSLSSPTALEGRTHVVQDVEQVLADRGYEVAAGGQAATFAAINERVGADIGRAEGISAPVLLILLIVVLGGVIAASLPLVIGALSIVGSFAALRLISEFTDVSSFAINIITILGLGLAIDYGLLIVGRCREELAGGHDSREAPRRTVLTAGKTVAVSALTVAAALSGLLLFPLTFLRSMGFGGVSAGLIAAFAAGVVRPAILASIGTGVNRWTVRKVRSTESPDGRWARLARTVMRRPVVFLLAALAFLMFLAAPFLGVRFGGVDERVLPADAEPRQVSAQLEDQYGVVGTDPIVVALDLHEQATSGGGQQAIAGYLTDLQQLPDVETAQLTGAAGTVARVEIGYAGEGLDDAARSAVDQVRELGPTAGIERVQVGGPTAALMDRLDTIGEMLPWMALVVFGATFVVLFLAFGSVLLPLKAIALNLVTLAATLGVVTWIFQDGNGAGLLDFTSTGFVEASMPLLVMTIVFGLSMDYEVFLLSRIREQYDRTGDNSTAVATGLQRTGRIITSAALLILVVIALFSTSSISFIKLIGVAMIVAILLDALLVRMIVVPAAMRLMGGLNWWLPGPLRRLYDRIGFREELPDGDRPRGSSPTDADEPHSGGLQAPEPELATR